jgi:PAS domain S-box-containing protein
MDNLFYFFDGVKSQESISQMNGFHSWLYTASNIAIWLAFFVIAGAEIYLIRKRKDLSYKIVFWIFICFISFFGITYLLDAFIFWLPIARFIAYIKFITALVAWGTFFVFWRIMPKMLTMKSQKQLKTIIEEQLSELNTSNKKLSEKEQQFRILVNNNPDSICQLDKDFRYTFVNKTILELTGVPENFFVGKTIYELGSTEEFIKDHEKHLKIAFEQGEFSEFETTSELPRGPRTFHISIVPVWNNEHTRVETVLSIAKDITAQKEFEQDLNDNIHELQELSGNLVNKNRQLQDFAYIVSHNLRSPMSNLVALMNLYDKEVDQDQKNFLVKKIGEVTRSFSQTIDELTEVVKIRNDKEIEFQNNKFEEVVGHIKTMLDPQIRNSNTTITYDFSNCETIRYPKVYLESILQNLITNAIKYRSNSRSLNVRLHTEIVDGSILLSCKDNGLGLDLKKYGDKIFGMNKTFHPNADSRGMGLFITKNQVESLGGSITVESEPDKGAEFTILFS